MSRVHMLAGVGVAAALFAPSVSVQWSVTTATGLGAEVAGVWAHTSKDVWAVGLRSGGVCQYQTLAERYDGSDWSVVATPNVPGVNTTFGAVTADPDGGAWAVGQSGCPSVQDPQPVAARWTGRKWVLTDPVAPESSNFSAVAALAADDVWAVGGWVDGSVGRPLIEHWDGAWHVSPSPAGARGSLSAVASDASGDVWAVGSAPAGGSDMPIAFHWNGAAWRSVPVPMPNGQAGLLTGVVVLPDGALVVGGTRPGGGGLQPFSARWTGDHWRPVSLPDLGPFASLEAVAIGADGRPWAVGFTVDAVSSRPVVVTFARGAPAGWGVVPAPPAGNFPTAVSVAPDRSVWVVDGNAIEHGTRG